MTVIKPQKRADIGLTGGTDNPHKLYRCYIEAAVNMADDEAIEIPVADGQDIQYVQQALSRAVRMTEAKGSLGTRRANGRLYLVKTDGGDREQ